MGIITVVVGIVSLVSYRKSDICKDCNLIVISVDTLRPDHMGIYGYNKNTTPYIDAWAKNAHVFKNAYTIFPLTLHSFFTLFTGKDTTLFDPNLTTAYPVHLDSTEYKDVPTLQSVLGENGYKTAAFVLNPVIGATFHFFKNQFDQFKFINTSELDDNDRRIYLNTSKDQTEVTTEAISWMKQNKSEKFHLWVHYLDPHHPYTPSKEDICKIDSSCDTTSYNDTLNPADDETTCLYSSTPKNTEMLETLYDGEIRNTDRQIGKILDEIRKLNLDKKSVVVLYADHGEGFDHNIFHHGNTLYDSGVKIPFIISGPNVKAGITSSLIDNTDMMPLFLSLLDIEPKDKPQIDHLYNLLFPKNILNSIGKNYVYFATPSNKTRRTGITDGRYTYINSDNNYCLYNNFRKELYDSQNDKDQVKNIIGSEAGIAKTLSDKLNAYFWQRKSANIIPTHTTEEQKIIDTFKNLGY